MCCLCLQFISLLYNWTLVLFYKTVLRYNELNIRIWVTIVDRVRGFLKREVVGEKRSDVKIFAKVFKDGGGWCCLDWQWGRDGVTLRPMGGDDVSKKVTRYHGLLNGHGRRTFDGMNQFWKFVEIFQHFSKSGSFFKNFRIFESAAEPLAFDNTIHKTTKSFWTYFDIICL